MRGVRTLGLCIPLTRADGATSPDWFSVFSFLSVDDG